MGQTWFNHQVDLAALINIRRRQTGDTYRTMEERAKTAGHPISRSVLNEYAKGNIRTHPSDDTITALTAALDLPRTEVAAAVHETFGVDGGAGIDAGRQTQHVNAWLRLTADRSEAEVEHLLKVVEVLLSRDNLDQRKDR